MPIDTSIYSNIKQPPTYSLGDILGVAQGVQNLRTSKIAQQRQGVALEQEQGALDARNAVGQVISDPQYHDPNTGLFDMDRGAAAIVKADPKNYVAGDIIKSLAQANNDLITVKKASLGLADTSRTLLGSTVGALATKPDLSKADIASSLDQLRAQAPDAAPIIDVWERGLKSLPDDPKALQGVVMKARAQVMPPGTQQVAQTPSGIQVDNGQQSAVVNTNPGAAPVGSVIPGTAVQKQLPPTTPVFNSEAKQPGYLGPTGAAPAAAGPSPNVSPAAQQLADQQRLRILMDERAREANNPNATERASNLHALDIEIADAQRRVGSAGPAAKSGFVASGPALGTAENVAGTVDAVNKDWQATVESARNASQDIGVLQNIKKFAKGAVMGVEADRRAFMAGMAGLLHIDAGELAKTNTDLLAKNTTMLALAGNDTNLARTMASMMNPNNHMTPEAAEDAANQLVAQRKLALAKQQYLSHFKGDPELYTQKLTQFNQIADPRILQLPDMTLEEKARMKAAMSPTEQREFGRKIREMQSLGLVQ